MENFKFFFPVSFKIFPGNFIVAIAFSVKFWVETSAPAEIARLKVEFLHFLVLRGRRKGYSWGLGFGWGSAISGENGSNY